ncbi:mucin-4-like [Toxotes jaculatrix]|uniref:mucin-4-like n=1 Tax=Toxotes jaculatrix TaxID=941984 RepID=UPI001B3A9923|nr:mucin-4-like [Toxotes jaculatrix]
MAFVNLFTNLSAEDEALKSPGQPAITRRSERGHGKRGSARKRKTQDEQTWRDKKKHCYPALTSKTYHAKSFKDNESKYMRCHMQNTDRERSSIGHNNMNHKGQNYKAKNNQNVNNQGGRKNQYQREGRGRYTNRGGHFQTRPASRRGGGDGERKDGKQGAQVERTRFMTQEFKDQNALFVNGRLLCRHFLWGKCIKGDDCQLEHIHGCNDLIQEVCKFYIQGFCTKGQSCPYMHKSFPCKFFHKRGTCSLGADCRFSHEPLTEITNRLLDEALKRENELYELTKKAEQEASGQPADADAEPEITEENRTPDVLMHPIRPNFYNSGETNSEQEALSRPTEELSDIMETGVPSQTSDAAQPHSPAPTNLNHKEPVCYSVEAVLGRQLFKPFSFFTTPGSQESAPLPVPLSASDCTSGSANQSKVPYSADAVYTVRSCKSVGNSTFGHIPAPAPAQTVSYAPKTHCEELTDPLQSSTTEKGLTSLNTRNELNKSQEKMFKSLSSLSVHTDLISETCPDLTLASEDHKKQGGEMPESLKPAQRGPPFSRKEDLKPHLSGLTSNSQASVKPLWPSSCFSECNDRAAVPAVPVTCSADSGDSVSPDLAEKQPTEIHQRPKKTQPGLKLGTRHLNDTTATETTAECSSKMADMSVGSKKTQNRWFYRLFEGPITDRLQPAPASGTAPACTQASVQPSCSTLPSAHCTSEDIHVVEPGEASDRPFLSLFATPPSASCSQGSNPSSDKTSALQGSEQRASTVETSLPHQVRTDVKQTSRRPTSPEFSPSPKSENEDVLSEPVNEPSKQQVNPVCSPACSSLREMSPCPAPGGDTADPATTQAPQQLPDMPSPKGSAAAAASNSVLKTLFLCLSPYQQDGEQRDSVPISVSSESEKKEKSTTACDFVRQQQKRKNKKRQKNKLKAQYPHQQSTEKTATHSSEHQSSFHTSPVSLEAAE